jgi:septal ring factor EnvC (AmiA/AmiB activator)
MTFIEARVQRLKKFTDTRPGAMRIHVLSRKIAKNNQAHKKAYAGLVRRRRYVKAKLKSTEAELNQTKAKVHDQQEIIDGLVRRRRYMKAKLKSTEAELKQTKAKVHDQQEIIDGLVRRRRYVKAKLNSTKAELEHVRRTLRQSVANAAKLQISLTDASESARSRAAEAAQEQHRLQARISQLEAEISQLEAEISQLETDADAEGARLLAELRQQATIDDMSPQTSVSNDPVLLVEPHNDHLPPGDLHHDVGLFCSR